MKFNKQAVLLLILITVATVAFLLIPNFEREAFDPEIVEDISTGTISTTTSLVENDNTELEENNKENTEEEFQPSVYDTLLINNSSKRIDGLFETYLIIGSDERDSNSSPSRGFVEGSRADVIMLVLVDENKSPSLISIPRDLLINDPCTKNSKN